MNKNTVNIKPAMIKWARERNESLDVESLRKTFPKLNVWENGEAQPTLKQLEDFAKAVRIPIGYLFLNEPVQETLPTADFRTIKGDTAFSVNLRDTIYLCQERQNWYRDYARINAFAPLDFIGSVTTQDSPVLIARAMRIAMDFLLEDQKQSSDTNETLRRIREKIEDMGVLVMSSGIVGNNTHRSLNVAEFRGFALVDEYAPLIFINAKDSKAAQLFTLAHELAHLWLGESGVSNSITGVLPTLRIEKWCNAVAAELLMPMDATRTEYISALALEENITRLVRHFKVSAFVVLYRLCHAGFIDETTLWKEYRKQEESFQHKKGPTQSGGDYYNNLGARVGRRFARVLLSSACEGQTLFRDAFHLLGVKASKAFFTQAKRLGVIHDIPS